MVKTMRVSLVTFVVSLLVIGLIRVWNAIIQYFDHRNPGVWTGLAGRAVIGRVGRRNVCWADHAGPPRLSCMGAACTARR
jgi:hypothetical protein